MQEPKIVTIESKNLIAMRTRMSIVNNKTRELWQGFRPRISEIQNRVGADFHSIQHYENFDLRAFSPTVEFERLAAVEVGSLENVPEGMEPYVLAGGQYAVFEHHGPATAFAKTFQYIFESWLPSAEYELDDRDHFELLGPDYRPDDPNAKETVWIPVK